MVRSLGPYIPSCILGTIRNLFVGVVYGVCFWQGKIVPSLFHPRVNVKIAPYVVSMVANVLVGGEQML